MSTSETRVVDAKEAEFLQRTTRFDLQRPMSESNVLRLEAEMRAGRFVPGTPIYIGALPDKTPLALNGQHTLEAIRRCGTAIELTFIYQDVADMAEAAAIYSRLDLHKLRSWRDSLRAHGAEDMLCDSTSWTSAFAAAIGFLFERFRVPRTDNERELVRIQAIRSRDVRLRAMRDAQIAATQYVQAIGEHAVSVRLYKRATVMAVGIEIMRYQAQRGTEFWSSLASDDGLRAGQPQRALLRYLREHHAAGAVAREAQAKAVAIAWNAFMGERKIDNIRPASMAAEIRIEGTPWVDKSFDPLRAYLPDLFAKVESEPAPRRRRRIVGGVDANMQPVAIVDEQQEIVPAA